LIETDTLRLVIYHRDYALFYFQGIQSTQRTQSVTILFVHEFALFLRLLAEKVYTARLSTGQRLLDASDFKQWLQELSDKAERETLEEFFKKLP
jgi:hypothetical protein